MNQNYINVINEQINKYFEEKYLPLLKQIYSSVYQKPYYIVLDDRNFYMEDHVFDTEVLRIYYDGQYIVRIPKDLGVKIEKENLTKITQYVNIRSKAESLIYFELFKANNDKQMLLGWFYFNVLHSHEGIKLPPIFGEGRKYYEALCFIEYFEPLISD